MTKECAETYLKSGGRLISTKRLDEVYYNSIEDKFILDFFQGNRLSGETTTFMWDFLQTFEFKR